MATPYGDRATALQLIRERPLPWLLVGLAPLVLAAGQVVLALTYGQVSAVGFAAVLVVFAVVATRHHLAATRVERLEQVLTEGTDR